MSEGLSRTWSCVLCVCVAVTSWGETGLTRQPNILLTWETCPSKSQPPCVCFWSLRSGSLICARLRIIVTTWACSLQPEPHLQHCFNALLIVSLLYPGYLYLIYIILLCIWWISSEQLCPELPVPTVSKLPATLLYTFWFTDAVFPADKNTGLTKRFPEHYSYCLSRLGVNGILELLRKKCPLFCQQFWHLDWWATMGRKFWQRGLEICIRVFFFLFHVTNKISVFEAQWYLAI